MKSMEKPFAKPVDLNVKPAEGGKTTVSSARKIESKLQSASAVMASLKMGKEFARNVTLSVTLVKEQPTIVLSAIVAIDNIPPLVTAKRDSQKCPIPSIAKGAMKNAMGARELLTTVMSARIVCFKKCPLATIPVLCSFQSVTSKGKVSEFAMTPQIWMENTLGTTMSNPSKWHTTKGKSHFTWKQTMVENRFPLSILSLAWKRQFTRTL